MKATLEIPDLLFRKAKSTAAERGQTLKQLVTEALPEKLAVNTGNPRPGEPGWMEGFGTRRRLRKETQRIQARIGERIEVVEPEGSGMILDTNALSAFVAGDGPLGRPGTCPLGWGEPMAPTRISVLLPARNP